MFFSFLTDLIKNMLLTGSYSNNVFPDPLSKEEELMYIEKHFKRSSHQAMTFCLIKANFNI
ncbi:MAG TPA: hypothetical protein GX725_00400 [Mollicutes bacterium]|nr:hypothetical protein [Mollicutes bacterium]